MAPRVRTTEGIEKILAVNRKTAGGSGYFVPESR